MLSISTKEKDIIEVPMNLARQSSATIENLMNDHHVELSPFVFPLEQYSAKSLKKVFQFCELSCLQEKNLFPKGLTNVELQEIILIANFLEMTELLQLCIDRVGDMIQGKSFDEIKTILNMDDDDD